MTALFYVFIAIVIATAFWQITNIFNLKDVIATDKDNQTQGKLMIAFMIFFYGLMIFSFWNYSSVLLPESASLEGQSIEGLYVATMVMIIIAQALVQFVIFWFAYKYRGSKDKKATYYADSHKLEMIWTIIPSVALAGLIIYGLMVWTDVMYPDEEDALVVEVYGKQFDWEVRYAGKDGVLGRANVRNIKGVNTMGVDMTDLNALDDIHIPTTTKEFYLPKGRKVIFKFRSQDVLHSAYMPHFRAQMNCVPGMITQFAFTPSMTTEEMRANPMMVKKVANIKEIRETNSKKLVAAGNEPLEPYEFDYLLLCNKICGASHFNMQKKIIVKEQGEFNKWLKEQKTLAQILKK